MKYWYFGLKFSWSGNKAINKPKINSINKGVNNKPSTFYIFIPIMKGYIQADFSYVHTFNSQPYTLYLCQYFIQLNSFVHGNHWLGRSKQHFQQVITYQQISCFIKIESISFFNFECKFIQNYKTFTFTK